MSDVSSKNYLDNSLLIEQINQVEKVMLECVAEYSPLASICAEHFSTGGKRIRAKLALASFEVFDGADVDAVFWAAAVEMFHNATLIHDDYQDGDRSRRGQATVWVKHGMVQAINAGDLLLVAPYLLIAQSDVSAKIKVSLQKVLAQASLKTIQGQALEQNLFDLAAAQLREGYLQTIQGKTAELFAVPVVGSALIAGKVAVSEAIGPVFHKLGCLFQMQDDILDLYGEKGRGEVGSDIKEGKISFLVVQHLETYPEDRDWLFGILKCSRKTTDQKNVMCVIESFVEKGTLNQVLEQMKDLRAEIIAVFETNRLLQKEKALFELTQELLLLVLKPIAHLI